MLHGRLEHCCVMASLYSALSSASLRVIKKTSSVGCIIDIDEKSEAANCDLLINEECKIK